jgi:hypothetical protein
MAAHGGWNSGLEVAIDFLDQFLHAAERSLAKSLLRNATEPDFHLNWAKRHRPE